jgi:NAD-dependent deacetylase
MIKNKISKVVSFIKKADHTVVFTGAGISAESGIPTFRGEDGFWQKYDPKLLTLDYFYDNPEESWKVIGETYKAIEKAKPNKAHKILAKLEKQSYINTIITQNIDGLHQKAKSKNVLQIHGSCRKLRCINCNNKYILENIF